MVVCRFVILPASDITILPWWRCSDTMFNLTNSTSVRLHPTPAPYMCSWDPPKIPSITVNITLRQSSIKMKHTHNDNTLHACKAGKINIWLMNEQWTLIELWLQKYSTASTRFRNNIFSTSVTKTCHKNVSRLWNHHDDPPISNSFDFMASSALKAKASFMSWSNVSKEKEKLVLKHYVFHVK